MAAAADAPRAHPSPAEPVIVHVRDLRSGEMDVFAGESKTRLHDPALAARLAHSVR